MHSSSATLGHSGVVPRQTSLCRSDARGVLVRVVGSASFVKSGPMASAAIRVRNIKAISARHNSTSFIVLIRRQSLMRSCKDMCAQPRGPTALQAKLRFRSKSQNKMKQSLGSRNGQATFSFLQKKPVTGTASTRYQLKEIYSIIYRTNKMETSLTRAD